MNSPMTFRAVPTRLPNSFFEKQERFAREGWNDYSVFSIQMGSASPEKK
jgi:hypothetical protein